MANRRCLLVFTKPAVPGRVKTRLIGELTAAEAAQLHAAFLGDLLERLGGGDWELRLAWALAPGERLPAAPWPGEAQQGEDLGERLWTALKGAAASHRFVAAVGSDHPELAAATVEAAFAALEGGAEVVLGPAEDGGYYLIALAARAVDRRLFEGIAWSTGEVYAATRARCAAAGLTVAELPAGADVDTPADLARLRRRLAADGGICPRTRALFATWDRLAAGGAR